MLYCIIKLQEKHTRKQDNYITMREKNQVVLPLDLEICIPEGDFVFKVAEICESLDYTELFNTYLRSWRKVNPITMFEVIVAKLEKKISVLLSVLCERYGFSENISLEDCYEQLCRQAQWLNLVFAVGKGKHKTQLQRDIETLKGYIDKKAEYYSHLGKFGNRNSFSKTDTDATFMHMKEDHMRNGQLKPGYNIQIGVESEYIVGVGSFSNRNDVGTLIPFLNRIRKNLRT